MRLLGRGAPPPESRAADAAERVSDWASIDGDEGEEQIAVDAQDGAGEAALEVVVEELELLPPLPPSEGAPELPPLLCGGGVHDELEDAMAGRAGQTHKKTLASHATCMRRNYFTSLMHLQ